MSKYLLSAIIAMLIIAPGVSADEVQFTATSRNLVSVGDRFQLTYSVNARGGEFSGPDIRDFRVLSGPNISTSQSYQVINGKMSQSVSVSYVYYLQAYKEGKFEIPPATVVIEGIAHTSNAVAIEVIGAGAPASVPKNQQQAPAAATGGEAGTQDPGKDVFLRAYVTNNNPYLGEQVIITYKIYTANVPISDIDIENLASFPGFWSTNLTGDRQQIEPRTEIIDGKEYLTGELYRAALFPQKAGKIMIDAKKLSCTAQVRTQGTRRIRDPFFDSFFDDPFFNNQYQNVRIEMESNPLTINVKPLPVDRKPAGFSGAVGRFQLEGSVDKSTLALNDALTLKLTISGSGNLELINTPDINWPPDFETYDPKISNNIRTSDAGVTGTRTFEYLAIPRSAGDFTIGPVELSYFDPVSGTYRTLSTETYDLSVEKGDQQASAGVTYSGVAQEDIMYLGQDIRYIKTGNFPLQERGNYLFGSTLFFLTLAVPVILLVVVIFLVTGNRRKRSNIALMRNRKATRVARKNLRKASDLLKSQQREAFYAEVSRALWGYLSDKFNIPLSDLSMDSVSTRLASKGVGEASISRFIEVLNKCEFARFAPGDSTALMNEVYDDSIKLISMIESELK